MQTSTRFLNRVLSLLCSLLVLATFSAHAETIRLSGIPEQSLGTYATYLIEGDRPLSLVQAMKKQQAGDFKPVSRPVPNFGIGSNPVWLHLAIDNDASTPVEKYFVGGMTWLDHLEIYVEHSGNTLSVVHTGDEVPGTPGLTPALGYVLPLQFAPGRNDVYIRVGSIDPMAFPLELMSKNRLVQRQIHLGYFYGFFFGFLAALSAYNLLLFFGLRERSYLYYSLTLGSILLCNFAYTGHGVGWLWSDLPGFQRYVILVLMVIYNAMGLLFASRFLALRKHAPRTLIAVKWLGGTGLTLMILALLAGSQLMAALVAFVCMGAFTIGMFLLGIMSTLRGQASGRYFLAATFFGMLGVASTAFAVWGKIPFTLVTFHASEIGLEIEATLLALALAYRMRQSRSAHREAERAARQDALTHLNNRRAFVELAIQSLNAAERHDRPLSLILMDIDHFKPINDKYGHKTGDDVLVAVADMLKKHCRASDIVARWGGEEFILLLTETDLEQACSYAERLRQAITEVRLPDADKNISLTASFGISGRTPQLSLEGMIEQADVQLYQAKRSGRNKVCCVATPDNT
jgi:diguanylate cyclase (GGDEF)-like protein